MFSYFCVTYLASDLHFVGGQKNNSDTGSFSTFSDIYIHSGDDYICGCICMGGGILVLIQCLHKESTPLFPGLIIKIVFLCRHIENSAPFTDDHE